MGTLAVAYCLAWLVVAVYVARMASQNRRISRLLNDLQSPQHVQPDHPPSNQKAA